MHASEIVLRAIEFRRPPRLPIRGYGDASDFAHVGPSEVLPPEAEAAKARGEKIDQWLCRWAVSDVPNMGLVAGHPLEDLSRMDAFPWPDPDDPRRYAAVPERCAAIAADPALRHRYVTTGIFMLLWERMQALHGFENCLMDLMDDRPEIHALADRLVEYDLGTIRNMHAVAGDHIHGFGFSEDWGTQQDLHVSPELFRRFFLPRYRRIFDAIHACGWKVHMHSCGRINRAIPMLIDAGVDALQMLQPQVNGIEEIGRDFAGKVCFETLCDIQRTIPGGDRDAIRREAELLLQHWGTPEGGFILSDYGDAAAIGAAHEYHQVVLDTFRSLDPWLHRHATVA